MMDKEEAAEILTLAIGRLFRLGSRPSQPEDLKTYYALRTAAMDAAAILGIAGDEYIVNYVKDQYKL